MKKNILIISGANAKISQSLFEYIFKVKKVTEFSEVILITKSKNLFNYSSDNLIKIHNIKLDYNKKMNLSKLKKICNNCNIFIFHAAALVPSKQNFKNSFYKINCYSPILLIKELKIISDNLFLFYISSTSVYDKFSNSILTESAPKTKEDKYGLSKLKFEKEIKKIKLKSFGLRVPVLLTKNVENNFFSKIKKQINNKEKISIGYPDEKFNAIGFDLDIFNLFLIFIRKKYKVIHEIYNLATIEPISLKKLLSQNKITNYYQISYPIPPRVINCDKLIKKYPNILTNTKKAFNTFINEY